MAHFTPLEQVHALLEHIEGAYSPNTIRAYRADILEFIHYCATVGYGALPAMPQTVANFLSACAAHGNKTATIRRKAASISAIHRLSGLQDPAKHPEVKIALRKISRQLGTRFVQAYPVTRSVLNKLLGVCSADLWGLRNRALLLLAYDYMCRRSELVSLRVEDMEWLSAQGMSVLLRRSKTDQHGAGKWLDLSTESSNAVEDWLQAAGIRCGLILRGILPNGKVTSALGESRIPRIYKSLAKAAGLPEGAVQDISGHSMRVGAAQDLLNQGASLPQIMVRGGWSKTDTVMRYVQKARGVVRHM